MRKTGLKSAGVFAALNCLFVSSYCNATEITLWHMAKELHPQLQQLAANYQQHQPDLKINIHFLPNEQLKASVIRSRDKSNAPDMVIFSSDNVGYAKVMRLSTVDEQLFGAELAPGVLAKLKFQQHLYSIPWLAGNQLFLFYNKKLVTKVATDWSELNQQAPALKARGIMPLAVHMGEPFWFSFFVSLWQKQLVQQDSIQLNTAAMVQALQFFHQLTTQKVIEANCDYSCVTSQFYDGKFAYAINGNWALQDAVNQLGDNFGLAPLPSYKGQAGQAFSSYLVMSFPNQSLSGTKKNALLAFAEYLRAPAQQQNIVANSYLPYRHQHQLQLVQQANGVNLNRLSQQLNSELMPSNNAMVSVWNGMQKGLDLYLKQTLSAEDAAAFMQTIAERDLQRLNQAGTLD